MAVRVILALGLFLFSAACAPRLDEQQVRTRLAGNLRLQNEQLHVRSIGREAQPVVSIDYGGVPARLRFRYQDGVWVIDAVEREGRWEPAEGALRLLASELSEKARASQMAEMMPRYARTLKLLMAWSTLLSADCGSGLPETERALLNLHAYYHRALFANRGGADVHNADMFVRDAWWKPLRVAYSPARVDVQTSGADLRLDTADDMRLGYTRQVVRAGITACMPHFAMPAWVADALGRTDAPAAWNCEDVMAALRRSGQLELIADRQP